jgi:hypothetical protein
VIRPNQIGDAPAIEGFDVASRRLPLTHPVVDVASTTMADHTMHVAGSDCLAINPVFVYQIKNQIAGPVGHSYYTGKIIAAIVPFHVGRQSFPAWIHLSAISS